jgi:hypothetical protein
MCAVAVALVVGLACSGCGGSDDSARGPATTGQFGGELEGTDALVGIAAGKERLTVYVCDDGTISEWFVTDQPARKVTLSSRSGAVATVVLAADAVSGTVTLADGSEHGFHATSQSTAVIHRAEAATDDLQVIAGWVTVGDRTTGALTGTPKVGALIVGPAPGLPPLGLVGLPVGTLTLPAPLVTIAGDPPGVATSTRFPEYTKVWRDGSLNVVAVFGTAEAGATGSQDAGIAAYDRFLADLKAAFPGAVTVPAFIPGAAGEAGVRDVELRASLSGDRSVRVNVLLVNGILAAKGPVTDRYGALSTGADLIAYVGRHEAASPERALVERGRWVTGQYVIAFVNCCRTYGNLRGIVAAARSGLNADDPKGTRYMDVVSNVEDPLFLYGRLAATALTFGLLNRDVPSSYDQILGRGWLVTGAEDNTFVPPVLPGGATSALPWSGIDRTDTVTRSAEKRFETEVLGAGSYLISLTGSGDADLYVRRGSPPTATTYDCRPFKDGSEERCAVVLSTPGRLHIMVRGQAPSSTFRLIGQAQ